MRVSKGKKKGTSNCLASCAAQERKKGINDEWAAERVKKEKLEEKPFFWRGGKVRKWGLLLVERKRKWARKERYIWYSSTKTQKRATFSKASKYKSLLW